MHSNFKSKQLVHRGGSHLKQSIKVIGFDLGYTLVFNQVREKLYLAFLKEKRIERTPLEVEHAYHLADKTFMRDYSGVLGKNGSTFFPWYLGLVNYYLNLSFDLFEQSRFFKERSSKQLPVWTPFPWTKDVLQELKDAGFTLLLLSNWDLSARSLLDQFELTDFFNEILISSEIGIEKPDPRVFATLLGYCDCDPSEVLYVGDNYYDDVIGAREMGLSSVLINRFGRLGIEEIKDCQVINDTRELLHLVKKDGVDQSYAQSNV